MLRVEDLDDPRTRPASVFGNLDELRWLGLDWDEGPDVGGAHGPYLQSGRSAIYQEALERLHAAGRVYECFLTRKELATIASAPHAAEAVYGARERRANAAVARSKRAQGAQPSLRFLAPSGPVRFVDALRGEQETVHGRHFGDPVLRRADGVWSYAFAVVVDDAAMGVTEVVRGDDLLPATGVQVRLHRALGHEPPTTLHLPLMLDENGERLAKRRGSLTLHALRDAGADPEAVVGWLAKGLGLIDEAEPRPAASLIASFDLARLAREPTQLQSTDVERFLRHA